MISLGSAAPLICHDRIKELVVEIKYTPRNERSEDMNDWMIVVRMKEGLGSYHDIKIRDERLASVRHHATTDMNDHRR